MSLTLKALVIDDSGVMRKMVMKSLTEAKLADFAFIEAADGKDALDKWTSDIGIAFVDWNMPTMSGVELVREVRAREKQNDAEPIPLVMVTSEKTIAKIEEALDEAGADSFISKPFTVAELAFKLKKVVDKAQLIQVKRARQQRQTETPKPTAAGGFFSKLFG
jgi:two-component system, chemotaxis family, chemotaxis protein CheY